MCQHSLLGSIEWCRVENIARCSSILSIHPHKNFENCALENTLVLFNPYRNQSYFIPAITLSISNLLNQREVVEGNNLNNQLNQVVSNEYFVVICYTLHGLNDMSQIRHKYLISTTLIIHLSVFLRIQ